MAPLNAVVDEPNLAKDPPPSLMIRSTLSITFWASPNVGQETDQLLVSSHGAEFRKNSEIFLRVNRCARLNTYRSGGVHKSLFVFVLEFVHHAPLGVKTPLRSFLLIRTLPRHFAVSVPGSSIGVDLTLGHLKAAFDRTA